MAPIASLGGQQCYALLLQKVGDLARLVEAQAGRLADQETDLHVCSICDTA